MTKIRLGIYTSEKSIYLHLVKLRNTHSHLSWPRSSTDETVITFCQHREAKLDSHALGVIGSEASLGTSKQDYVEFDILAA